MIHIDNISVIHTTVWLLILIMATKNPLEKESCSHSLVSWEFNSARIMGRKNTSSGRKLTDVRYVMEEVFENGEFVRG